jgi:ADP-glucose pyrophosphorylase
MATSLHSNLLAVVLAGGRGERLGPLTLNRCKPAVPFGKHHLLSFTLANIVNSDLIRHTYVLTQYRQQGILAILSGMNFEASIWDRFIRAVPAQQQIDNDWYSGSANAIHQNHLLVSSDPAEYVLVAAADHIYKMDYEQMLQAAIDTDADVLVSGMYMTLNQAASTFGVMEVGEQGNIKRFQEKPQSPTSHPGRDGECIISQGIYIFKKMSCLSFCGKTTKIITPVTTLAKTSFPKWLMPVAQSCSMIMLPTSFLARKQAIGVTLAASTPTQKRCWTRLNSIQNLMSITTIGESQP